MYNFFKQLTALENELTYIHILADEILKNVETMGVANTVKYLQESRCSYTSPDTINPNFILTCVSRETNVSVEKILRGTDKTDERKIAVSLCVFFMKDTLGYSFEEIKKILGKDRSMLSRYYQLCKAVNVKKPKGEFDKQIAGYILKLNVFINEIKIKNKK